MRITGVAALRPTFSLTITAVLFFCNLSSVAFAVGIQELYRITNGVSGSHVEYRQLTIPSGGEVLLADIQGPGKITYFYVTDNSQGRFYPGLVLKVFWDNEKDPSIHVPLSDFFGAIGSRTIDYQSAPMQINHYCYMCYLPMPFSKRARFLLANDGDEKYSRSVAYGIDYEKNQTFAAVKSRLHCCWRRSNPTQNGLHTLLQVRGKGNYIGNFLQIFSSYKGWWGEGDTNLHIDGKKIIHTPGTEDEYGSCWSFEHTFSYMYCGYIQNDKGNNRMYRWYLANPVRFRESLKVEIQNQRYKDGQIPSADDYISVAYWYQENRTHPVTLQSYRERTALSRAAEYAEK
jgi:hypothetical protein